MSQHGTAVWSQRGTTVVIGPLPSAGSEAAWLRPGEVAMTLPGEGSEVWMPGWTAEMFAQDVVDRFVGALDVVAIGAAAPVALTLLAQFSHRVRSGVIVCGEVSLGGRGRPASELRRRWAEASEVSEGGMEAVAEDVVAACFSGSAVSSDLPGVQQAAAALRGLDPRVWRDALTVEGRSPAYTAEMLGSMGQPVSIVAGSLDRVGDGEAAKALHDAIPRSRLEIAAVSHWVHWEQPQALRRLVDRHFAWAPEGTRVEEPVEPPGPWGGDA